MKYEDFLVSTPVKGSVVSSLKQPLGTDNPSDHFINDSDRILNDVSVNNFNNCLRDGTLRGSYAIHGEIKKRRLKITVAGIPNTNDQFTFLPISRAIAGRKKIEIKSKLRWNVPEAAVNPSV